MTRHGTISALLLVLAAAGFSLLLDPGKPGLIASCVLLACWLVLIVLGLVLRRRERERV